LLGVAALVRVGFLAWAYAHGVTIDSEGAEYARIAENLLAGRGYVGLFDNGVQLNFPPLYPVLIAALSLPIGDPELAARLINLLFGIALVVPMFQIADRMYGRRTAMVVGILTSLHPVLVARSISTYAEGPYLTLVMLAAAWVMRWMEEPRVTSAALAGLWLGLAYLTRPEAFLLVGALAAAAGVSWLAHRRRTTLTGVGALVGVFALVASPYVAFLTAETGRLRIEAKGTLAYVWGSRINAGMSYDESVAAIGPDLSGQGVFMRPNLEVLQSTSYSAGDMMRYLAQAAPRNVKTIIVALTESLVLGAPLLLPLVVLGLFRTPWERRRTIHEGVLLLLLAITVLALLSVQAFWFRYFYALLGPLIVWAGRGSHELGEWAARTTEHLGPRRRAAAATSAAVTWGTVLVFLIVIARALPRDGEFRAAADHERRAAGAWLRQFAPGPKVIMDFSLLPAYYAGGSLQFLPYSDGDRALRYIAQQAPAFIVLVEEYRANFPYFADWFDHGIPDRRAELVYDVGRPPQERIKIYRWRGGHGPGPSAGAP
jgi:4-amino-4-deoxy-L-arabinose transferase-like glycosyltransferase